jgi:hypothetical protein
LTANWRALLLGLLLTAGFAGCGGSPPSVPEGFINQTQHSTADLQTVWSSAQQSVASTIDLNPVQRANSDVPANILPGDPRALSVMPHRLTVAAQPDIPSAALFAATGVSRSDPTGVIECPHPCNVGYTPAYSFYQPPVTRYAASWEFDGNNFDQLLQYEFENQILSALGYDMTWR